MLTRELETACALAREGGALALAYLNAPSLLAVQMKEGGEPVTEADRAINELCVRRLRGAFPDDALLTEELPDDGSRHRAERTWLVDPIDGTKDFIAGRPGFAVMIGLLSEGQPVLGVVYQPVGDTLYRGAAGQGAYRERAGVIDRLRVSAVADLSAARLVSSATHRSQVVSEVRRQAGIQDEMSIGSVGIKLSLIAAGERDLYINTLGRAKLWDTCAPQAILTEAGGVLTDLTGAPIDYLREELRHTRGLLATNGLLHQQALERVRGVFTPQG